VGLVVYRPYWIYASLIQFTNPKSVFSHAFLCNSLLVWKAISSHGFFAEQYFVLWRIPYLIYAVHLLSISAFLMYYPNNKIKLRAV
jgi:hypothetical protein